MKKESVHPCFDRKASGKYGRVHLPVAPKCNVSCNYCNRKYDCVNESRPGVTSAVLSPDQARLYMREVMRKMPYIKVAGIAGPGDPMANAEKVVKTMALIKEDFEDMVFCLSSNGFAMPGHVEEIARFVSHATITINTASPETGANIYARVTDGKEILSGIKGGEAILSRQIRSLQELKSRDIMVKINFISIPGVNDGDVEEVARIAGFMGVDMMNIIPLIPTEGTAFADIEAPSAKLIKEQRAIASKYVSQMSHCRRCRSDAVGLLHKDMSGEMCTTISRCASAGCSKEKSRKVAIATREGLLVNEHLGRASSFYVWEEKDGDKVFVEKRSLNDISDEGLSKWEHISFLLRDCEAILTAQAGEAPEIALKENRIEVIRCSGLIEEALDIYFKGENIRFMKPRSKGMKCTKSLNGNRGIGCC